METTVRTAYRGRACPASVRRAMCPSRLAYRTYSGLSPSPYDEVSLQPAETALARAIVAQRLMEQGRIEVGPTLGSDPQFRIRNLPQEVVTDAHLARGANQQVRVGHPRCVQCVRDGLFFNL